ncbi:DUF7380 domain-containing protein [Kaistia granuli]|uniref:DUF7380 domain-containing protein n=1 Tax=Kaistia granuli TaxID=363259 RepID=UPI0003A29806
MRLEDGAAAGGQSEPSEIPLWLRATIEDFASVDIEAPIINCTSVDCHELSTAYRAAAEVCDGAGAVAAAQAYAMLSAVTNFYLKPGDVDAPFAPMLVMERGRSPIPEDFRGAPVAVLAYVAERIANPVLKARLCDVCWLLERKRQQCGRSAVKAYVSIAEGLDSGALKERFDRDDPLLGLTSRDVLTRALSMGRALGWDCDEVLAARAMIPLICERAVAGENLAAVQWFFEIDLGFRLSDAAVVATEIEAYLARGLSDSGHHIVVELWRLAARAYRLAKNSDGEFRCRIGAAETLAALADNQITAVQESHWLSQAIAEYHGIPGQKDRRTALRHRLIDVQSGIAEELSLFSHPMDLSEIVEHVRGQLEGDRDVFELLLIFADLECSPSPEKLKADAIASIDNHPLSSLFGASFHDHEGKVIHRAEGGLGDGKDNSAIRVQIAQHEGVRRKVTASGGIETARRYIVDRYFVGEDTFRPLVRASPFVPPNIRETYCLGFERFFHGDFTSALYILTPLLEASIRHVLKMHGNDVSSFDAAKQEQEDRSMSALFDHMRPEVDSAFGEAISTDIENVFLVKPGPSLRHALAHGLLNDNAPFGADAIYACWLIFRLCCIPLFKDRARLYLPS